MFRFIKDHHGPIASMKGTVVYDEYQKASQVHCNTKRQQEAALLKEVKARYKREQPVIDIQRQLKGLPLIPEKTVRVEDYIFTERVWAVDALFTFATSSSEEECKRWAEAINALAALCRLQEGKCPRRLKPSASAIKLKWDLTPPSVLDPPHLSDSILIECEPTQCIFCLGCEALPTETCLRSFHSRGDLKKHVHCKHLRHHLEGQLIICPHSKCYMDLTDTNHLQNHAVQVHKIFT